MYLYWDERRDIQWNIAWAWGKSWGRSPRDFPRAQPIFHRMTWLEYNKTSLIHIYITAFAFTPFIYVTIRSVNNYWRFCFWVCVFVCMLWEFGDLSIDWFWNWGFFILKLKYWRFTFEDFRIQNFVILGFGVLGFWILGFGMLGFWSFWIKGLRDFLFFIWVSMIWDWNIGYLGLGIKIFWEFDIWGWGIWN